MNIHAFLYRLAVIIEKPGGTSMDELEILRQKRMNEMLKGRKMDKPIEITDETFKQKIEEHPLIVIDCWAPWCGPCRMVAPVLEQLASEYAGRLKIAKLNVDENPGTASKYGIQSIPTMLLFKNGNLVNSLVGALPKHEIERHLGTILTT